MGQLSIWDKGESSRLEAFSLPSPTSNMRALKSQSHWLKLEINQNKEGSAAMVMGTTTKLLRIKKL